jgi:hypothetical protein
MSSLPRTDAALERLTALQILSEHCSQVYLIDSS